MISKFSTYFRLFRGLNLVFIVLVMYILRYFLIVPWLRICNNAPFLTDDLFNLMVLAVVFITAAGYVINDYYDQIIDGINKSSKQIVGVLVSPNVANILFWVFSILGSILGIYISFRIGHINLGSIFMITSFMLYYYSLKYKRLLLWGNLVVAFLSAMVILMPWLFEFFAQLSSPSTFLSNNQCMNVIRQISFILFGFAFLMTLIREWIKDMEDIEGDKKGERISLPIRFGIKSTKLITLSTILIVLLTAGILQFLLIKNNYSSLAYYSIATISAPLLYLSSKLWTAKNQSDFHFASTISKLIMLMGILFLILCYYVIFKY
ncbi:MAG: geranylgeranylglycerol-phosphate geranylgeranyltransferase [Bacteroidota bacterium]